MKLRRPVFFALLATALLNNRAARAEAVPAFDLNAFLAQVSEMSAEDGQTITFVFNEGGCNPGFYGPECKSLDELCPEEPLDSKYLADRAAAEAKLAAAKKVRDEAVTKIENRKKGSLALDIVGIGGGIAATAGGAVGIAKSGNIMDQLNAAAQSMQDCRDAIGLWRRQYSSFDKFALENYDTVKDYSEYKSVESAQMKIANANEFCNAAFEPNDYYAIQSDIKGSGVSSGVALAGGVGTMVTSTGAIAAKETEDKKNWRIASTVSSGVSTIAGVVSTVIVNKVKKILQDAKDRNAKCLAGLGEIRI